MRRLITGLAVAAALTFAAAAPAMAASPPPSSPPSSPPASTPPQAPATSPAVTAAPLTSDCAYFIRNEVAAPNGYDLGLYLGSNSVIRVAGYTPTQYNGWCFAYIGTGTVGPEYHIIANWNQNNCLTWNESADYDDLVACSENAVASKWEVVTGEYLPVEAWQQVFNAYFPAGNACLRGDVQGGASYVATCANIPEQWWIEYDTSGD